MLILRISRKLNNLVAFKYVYGKTLYELKSYLENSV